jgi:hypothetical protein
MIAATAPDQAPPDAKARFSKRRPLVFILLMAAGLVLVLVALLGTLHAAAGSGHISVTDLQSQITAQTDQRLSDPAGPYYDAGVSVTSVTCIPLTSDTDTCNVQYSDGSGSSVTVTLGKDGAWAS